MLTSLARCWLGVAALLALDPAAAGDEQPLASRAAQVTDAEPQLDVEGALALAKARFAAGEDQQAEQVLRRGLKRFDREPRLWLLLIDGMIARNRYAVALRHVERAERQLGSSPELHLRAARAYFGLGQFLGRTHVRSVPDGRIGQFVTGALLIERRGDPDRFLSCPPASALYQVRRALDGGRDVPQAHLLHARIWSRSGRPKEAFAILKAREAVLLPADAEPDGEVLATLAELALAADELRDFLRYRHRQARQQPDRRSEILHAAYLAAALRYNERGEEGMFLRYLRQALEVRPDDHALMLRVADAEWDAGRRSAAAVRYRRLLSTGAATDSVERIVERLAEQEHSNIEPR